MSVDLDDEDLVRIPQLLEMVKLSHEQPKFKIFGQLAMAELEALRVGYEEELEKEAKRIAAEKPYPEPKVEESKAPYAPPNTSATANATEPRRV